MDLLCRTGQKGGRNPGNALDASYIYGSRKETAKVGFCRRKRKEEESWMDEVSQRHKVGSGCRRTETQFLFMRDQFATKLTQVWWLVFPTHVNIRTQTRSKDVDDDGRDVADALPGVSRVDGGGCCNGVDSKAGWSVR